MPRYEFWCRFDTCTHYHVETEVIQKWSDPAPKCEACGEPMEKLLSVIGRHIMTGDNSSSTRSDFTKRPPTKAKRE